MGLPLVRNGLYGLLVVYVVIIPSHLSPHRSLSIQTSSVIQSAVLTNYCFNLAVSTLNTTREIKFFKAVSARRTDRSKPASL
jgi:hypothetical protein